MNSFVAEFRIIIISAIHQNGTLYYFHAIKLFLTYGTKSYKEILYIYFGISGTISNSIDFCHQIYSTRAIRSYTAFESVRDAISQRTFIIPLIMQMVQLWKHLFGIGSWMYIGWIHIIGIYIYSLWDWHSCWIWKRRKSSAGVFFQETTIFVQNNDLNDSI